MTQRFAQVSSELQKSPRRWVVTGVAGFIGSNLAERLLSLGQHVVGLDNFATGHRHNLDDLLARVQPEARARFQFIEGDIRDGAACAEACRDADVVLHQAALGSVPRSVQDPVTSNAVNVEGTLNMLVAARDAQVKRFVYASSSSVYGDDTSPTKREDRTGQPLSPYAATKFADELYAATFFSAYGFESIGLRYFNVFGPRQDPNGPYAAVIPRWIEALLDGKSPSLFGEGNKSRDFCFVDNVVQANILAGTADRRAVEQRVFNIACGERTTLEDLFQMIRSELSQHQSSAAGIELAREPARVGDIPHSLAEIARAEQILGYAPTHRIQDGLKATVAWYVDRKQRSRRASVAA